MTERGQPIQWIVSPDHNLIPANNFWLGRAKEQYTVGQRVATETHFERSSESHRHMFAVLHEIWLSLPEELAQELPTVEHLRKHCLVKCGYADRESLVCKSRAEALRIATFIARGDTYAVVTVEGSTVIKWTAQSQSIRAMGGKKFQESKSAILDCAAALVGAKASDVQESA